MHFKTRPLLLALLAVLWLIPAYSQSEFQVRFARETVVFPANFDQVKAENSTTNSGDRVLGFTPRFIQFEQIPTAAQREKLTQKGLVWCGYVHFGAYLTLIPAGFDLHVLDDLHVRSIVAVDPNWKIARTLIERPFGEWAVKGDQVEIVVQVYPHISIEQGASLAETDKINIIRKGNQNGVLYARIGQDEIDRIAALPWVKWIELIPQPSTPDDINGRSLHRVNLLDSDHPLGKKYNGLGVNALTRDDGLVGPHADFKGRLYNQPDALQNIGGTHGDGVSGIIAGAGNIDPTKKGMAAGADLYVVNYTNDFQDQTLNLHLQNHVTVTNTSYSDGCNVGYTTATQTVDNQIFEHPELMHVFSAGNSNGLDCDYGAGNQWGNVTGGHKMAKNAITTANLRVDGVIETSSSRGPAHDGRMKPDISAHGTDQNSTDPNNEYQVFGGTSAAAPSIAGCMVQLTQAYREINNVAEAPTALLKTVMLNTANEMGNVGPDFIFGWGHVNNYRALNALENHQYDEGVVDQSGNQEFTLVIPAGVKLAKIMALWVDPPAETGVQRALVNDLDLTLVGPDGTVYRPWKLDPTPNATILNTPAGTGRDSLNNVEQVAVTDPPAGVYTVKINGYEVPQGPQNFYISWDFLDDGVKLIYPAGGEGLVPGATEWIRWDAYGNTANFLLRYSKDGGASWTNINQPTSEKRSFQWTVPANVTSGRVLVSVARGTRRDTTDFPLTIAPLPTGLAVDRVCPDSMYVHWNPLANDTLTYDVFLLGQKYMELKGTTDTTVFAIYLSNPADEQWFSVRSSHPSGLSGRRAIAVPWEGGLLGCPQPDDAVLTNILEPALSSIISCGALSQDVKVSIGNEGLNAIENATISYQLGTGTVVTENLATIAPGATVEHLFGEAIPLIGNAQATLKVWVTSPGEDFPVNDTLEKKLSIVVQNASQPFSEGFESSAQLPNGWAVENPDNGLTWEVTPSSLIGSSGDPTHAVWINMFSYSSDVGAEDYLYMLPLDLSSISSPGISFDLSKAGFTNYTDGMRIELIPDCDFSQTPVVIWEKYDPELLTVGYLGSEFSPTSPDQWRNEVISLDNWVGQSVIVRFIGINGYGNNLFIDNIRLTEVIVTPPSAEFDLATDTICRGEYVTYQALDSLAGSTYDWTFGIGAVPSSASGPGPHTIFYPTAGNKVVRLIATNGFGADTSTQLLRVLAFPTANYNYAATPTEQEIVVNFTNTSANATGYLWDFGDPASGAANTSTEVNPVHTYQTNGSYTVVLTAYNECTTVQKSGTLVVMTDAHNLAGFSQIRLSPNPSSGDFQLEMDHNQAAASVDISLIDASGRIIHQHAVNRLHNGVNVARFEGLNLPSGQYQIRIVTPGGVATLGISVQH